MFYSCIHLLGSTVCKHFLKVTSVYRRLLSFELVHDTSRRNKVFIAEQENQEMRHLCLKLKVKREYGV